MKKIIIPILTLVCAVLAFATPDKVLQVFRNGELVNEYNIDGNEYEIDVNDKISAPRNLSASVENNSIIISWEAVSGATYSIYRSSDDAEYSLLGSGISQTFYTDASPLAGTNYYKVKAVVNQSESVFSGSVAAALPNSDMESGLYLGVMGFNNGIIKPEYPISLLTTSTVAQYNDYIENKLSTSNGTTVCYAVDQSISRLQAAQFPQDLYNVAIVTFTDGLDNGSPVYLQCENKEECLAKISERYKNETVSGHKITAYSIGLKGVDIAPVNYPAFRDDLESLASSDENFFEVENMAEVENKFKEIARELLKTNNVQEVSLRIPVGSYPSGTRIRIQFDNASNVETSTIFMEGNLYKDIKNGVYRLENIEYNGMACESGGCVQGAVEDMMFIRFFFEGIVTGTDEIIRGENIMEWYYVGSALQQESEFEKDQDFDILIERKSAAIMLVLDCSTSLGDDFITLQNSAKSFISMLANATPEDSGNPNYNGHEYVDLGLPSGLKWATCNVGASSPSEYGDYYAWGETSTKSEYTRSNSKTYGDSSYGNIGGNYSTDAARANWGGTWRLPSESECEELKDCCTWTWTTQGGSNGYKVKGPNGNTIFLPAAGYRLSTSLYLAGEWGDCWSSTPYSGSYGAYSLGFNSSGRVVDWNYRYYGRSVRPVSE